MTEEGTTKVAEPTELDTLTRARAALDADDAPRLTPAAEFVVRAGIPVVLGWLAAAAGAVTLVVGWVQVSGTRDLPDELSYLSSATAGGLFLLGAAGLLVLSHHYAETRRSVDALRHAMEAVLDALERAAPRPDAGAADEHPGFVRIPSTRTYHRPDCIFVANRRDVLRVEVDDGGVRPCQVCAPDE